eukprot:TRINITY_DN4636_c1_g1_i1.p1 TRINITY_DN4636_c1_g1~~TRINITY_DN4636_c1_g1_i1.p1  ORF type:complete len:567 (+),score=111.80 TRINITY_DN4636_c1_g1_i1:50-1702(+)
MAAASSRKAFAAYSNKVKDSFLDPHMKSLLALYNREHHLQALVEYAKVCGHDINELAQTNNHVTMMPRLAPYDRYGNKVERVVFPEEYHKIGRLAYGNGVMTRYLEKGKEFETLSLHYLLAQNGEAGHCCPMACTAGLIKSLLQEDLSNPVVKQWVDKLTDPNYDTHFHGSQFLTEVQGGSDVGANELKATPSATHSGWYHLNGEKWFCSVADAHLWLVVARPEGNPEGTKGLRGFVVPRHLPETGALNSFTIKRLKDKLGTRTMASGEIDFTNTLAYPLKGDFKNVLETVINTSRVYNAVSCVGILQRSYAEARSYAEHRLAFGAPIIKIPAVVADLCRLQSEAYGARAVTFYLTHMVDKAATSGLTKEESGAIRMLVNVNKYWTAEASVRNVHTAIDVLGGNGAIEEFSVMPRLLRDAVVCAQWEGPHNTLCSQVLRDSLRLGLHNPMFSHLRALHPSPLPRLDALEKSWSTLLTASPIQAGLNIRPLVHELQYIVQYILLKMEGSAQSTLIAEHILKTNEAGWSPLTDDGYGARIHGILTGEAKAKL